MIDPPLGTIFGAAIGLFSITGSRVGAGISKEKGAELLGSIDMVGSVLNGRDERSSIGG
jgi:hypothetical protein